MDSNSAVHGLDWDKPARLPDFKVIKQSCQIIIFSAQTVIHYKYKHAFFLRERERERERRESSV